MTAEYFSPFCFRDYITILVLIFNRVYWVPLVPFLLSGATFAMTAQKKKNSFMILSARVKRFYAKSDAH